MTMVIQFARQSSPQARPAAGLAFHPLVTLLEQALAFAILALLLLLDVGTFFIGHDSLPARMFAHAHEGRILDYKQDLFDPRTSMITRRKFMLTSLVAGAIAPRARAAQPSPNDS